MRVVRPRRSFRVVLHAEQRQRSMPQPLQRVVIQIDVGLNDLRFLQRIWIDGEVVIMCRNLDLARLHLLHRMIAAMVPEFELVSPAAQRQPDQLMTKTNSKDRSEEHTSELQS